MSTPTIFITHDPVLDDVLEQAAERLQHRGVHVVRGQAPLRGQPPHVPPALQQADLAVFTMRTSASAEVLRQCPRLHGVVYPTIGVETLDLGTAYDLGIAVGHGAMPENYLGVAEATILLMLMLLYNPIATHEVALGQRPRPQPNAQSVWATMLRRKTVGLLGFGRLGRAIAARLQGWEVDILTHDPYVAADALPPNVRQVALSTLLHDSDLVVVLVALTPETTRIINRDTLASMRPEAYLINVSRGEAVDEMALHEALSTRRLAGAALDVSQPEPMPVDNPLLHLPNCFVTPHMVGQTREVFEAIVPTLIDNLEALLCGQAPRYFKNPEVLSRWHARRLTSC